MTVSSLISHFFHLKCPLDLASFPNIIQCTRTTIVRTCQSRKLDIIIKSTYINQRRGKNILKKPRCNKTWSSCDSINTFNTQSCLLGCLISTNKSSSLLGFWYMPDFLNALCVLTTLFSKQPYESGIFVTVFILQLRKWRR